MLLACVERVCPKGRDGAVSMPLSALRSLLFTPANDPRKLARALESEADAVIGDLEDAVLDGEKASARDGLAQGFAAASGSVTRLVRVNGAATPYFDDDLALLPALGLDGVVLPKATPEGVAALSRLGLPILAIIETALGVRCAHEIASSPAVFALLLGAVDLASELGLEPRADGLELLHIRSRLVVDSAKHEVILYAGPFRVPGMASMAEMPGMSDMPGMGKMPAMSGMDGVHADDAGKENHAAHAFSPLVRFVWPVDGWYRGFEVSLVDSSGAELPQHLMHHLVGIDFAHRQHLEGDLVRFIAAGVETHNVVLPRFLGVPMKNGQQLAIYAGWHNPGPKDYEGVYIRLAMPYLAAKYNYGEAAALAGSIGVNANPAQIVIAAATKIPDRLGRVIAEATST